jgi:hypothetical protein
LNRAPTCQRHNHSYGYAPSADGKRFLIVTTAGQDGESPPLTVVVNWLVGSKK